MINPMDLTGKHIIVTGGSAGIGKATCILASQLGAKVSIVARNEQRLAETLSLMEGEGHRVYPFDLNETEEIEGLVSRIIEENGAIDGLVHCAGIGRNRPIKMTKPDVVSSMMKIHYQAFVELMRAASGKKRTNENGSYIGISSIASIQGQIAQGAYAAAKGAMNAVVHPFAKELAPKGIRVNTIAFGMIDTDMYQDFLQTGGNQEELLRNQYLGIIPVDYAAQAICFLLSDASRYITGTTMYYDAGTLS